jgi:hypothetical protein
LDNDAEILRLRDKVHALAGTVQGYNYWAKDVNKWRQKVENQVDEIHETLEAIIKADEIADGITSRIKADHTLRLTKFQKIVVSGAGIAAIADFILRLTGKG